MIFPFAHLKAGNDFTESGTKEPAAPDETEQREGHAEEGEQDVRDTEVQEQDVEGHSAQLLGQQNHDDHQAVEDEATEDEDGEDEDEDGLRHGAEDAPVEEVLDDQLLVRGQGGRVRHQGRRP